LTKNNKLKIFQLKRNGNDGQMDYNRWLANTDIVSQVESKLRIPRKTTVFDQLTPTCSLIFWQEHYKIEATGNSC